MTVTVTPDGDDQDYITILPARYDRQIVVIMRYHKRDDEYVQGKVSHALKPLHAKQLAEAWAAATGLEIKN